MRSVGQHAGAGVQARVAAEEEDGEHDQERAGDELRGEGETVQEVRALGPTVVGGRA